MKQIDQAESYWQDSFCYSGTAEEINSEVVTVTLDGWQKSEDFKVTLNFGVFNVRYILDHFSIKSHNHLRNRCTFVNQD